MNTTPSYSDRFDKLEALMAAGFGELRAEIGELKADVSSLTDRVGALEIEVGDLRADVAEVRVRVDAVYARVDDLHGQIKFVADGHKALLGSIADLKHGFGRLEARQEHLELRMIAVESRLAS